MRLKSFYFSEIWIIPPPPLLFFRTPYNYILCRQILWIDFRTWGSSPLVTKGKTLELWLLRENVCGHDTAIFTTLFLIRLTLWFHKVFKLFRKSLEKTSMGNFLWKFSYTFSTIILWSTYEQLLTWICYCVSNQK